MGYFRERERERWRRVPTCVLESSQAERVRETEWLYKTSSSGAPTEKSDANLYRENVLKERNKRYVLVQ